MAAERKFDIILFDLEGTIVDFQWRLNDAVKEILKVLVNAGIDPALYGQSPSYAGLYNTTRDITNDWKMADSKHLFDRLAAIYERYDRDALSRWAPYPDTVDTLVRLSDCGYRMGVVSNCGSIASCSVLEKFGLAVHFEIVLSRNDVEYLKPRPESLKLALKKLCAPAGRSLFVGDSINDILAADRVPMASCFLSVGESLVTGEDADIATFQISSLSMLSDILIL
ncbi:MAG: HAD family hydrolase [Desulfobacterales bacterium]